MKKVVLIIGMHRSGTSLVARAISGLGVDFGNNLMPPKEDNPQGFYEHLGAYKLNERILSDCGTSWDRATSLQPLEVSESNRYVQEIKKILLQDFAEATVFGIKDPRISVLFPLWRRAITELGFELKVVFCHRNPFAVTSSLRQRNDIPDRKGLDLWASYNFLGELSSRNLPRLSVGFEEYTLDEPAMQDRLHLFIHNSPREEHSQLLVDNDLIHNSSDNSDLDQMLPATYHSLTTLLQQNKLDHIARFDQLRQEAQNQALSLTLSSGELEVASCDNIKKSNRQLSNLQLEIERYLARFVSGLNPAETGNTQLEAALVTTEDAAANESNIGGSSSSMAGSRISSSTYNQNDFSGRKNPPIEGLTDMEELVKEQTELSDEIKNSLAASAKVAETQQRKIDELQLTLNSAREKLSSSIALNEEILAQKITLNEQLKQKVERVSDLESETSSLKKDLMQSDSNVNKNKQEYLEELERSNEQTSLLRAEISSLNTKLALDEATIRKNEQNHRAEIELSNKQICQLTDALSTQKSKLVQANAAAGKSKQEHLEKIEQAHNARKADIQIFCDRANQESALLAENFRSILQLVAHYCGSNERSEKAHLGALVDSVLANGPEVLKCFDEQSYLDANPDVADALGNGQFISSLEHFLMFGINESRPYAADTHEPILQQLPQRLQELKLSDELPFNAEPKIDLPPLPKLKDTGRFKFHIDFCNANLVKGWLFSLEPCDNGYTLALEIDGDICERSKPILNITREDVSKAFSISPECGFHVSVSPKHHDGKQHRLRLILSEEDKQYVVVDSLFRQDDIWATDQCQQETLAVLFCSHNLKPQGAQNSLFELATGLLDRHNINPIVFSPFAGELGNRYRKAGIKVLQQTFEPSCISEQMFHSELEQLAENVAKLNVDALVVNTLQMFYMIYVGEKLGIPTLYIPRESEPAETYYNYLAPELQDMAVRSLTAASNTVFVAASTRSLWQEMYPDHHFDVIHNSLRTNRENISATVSNTELRAGFGIDPSDIVLLSIGTVCPRKGQSDFALALEDTLSANKNTKAVIAGFPEDHDGEQGDYSRDIINLVDQLKPELRQRVLLFPETDRINYTSAAELYRIADILVFSSRIESFPRVILEAMYFGLPIVSTPCFGVVEQCIEGKNALFYPAEDIVQLSAHLNLLIDDEKLRSSYGKQSKSLFSHMQTYNQMLDNYYSKITNLTKNHHEK